MRADTFETLEQNKRTVVCFVAAERILAFKSRVEEAKQLIEGIPPLEEAITQLVNQMGKHAVALMREAFDLADDDGDETSTEEPSSERMH